MPGKFSTTELYPRSVFLLMRFSEKHKIIDYNDDHHSFPTGKEQVTLIPLVLTFSGFCEVQCRTLEAGSSSSPTLTK